MDWESGKFSIVTTEGEKTVTGLIGEVFGIHDVGERREHWAVTHIPTGLKLTPGNGFLAVESAQCFVEKIFPKADWKTFSPSNPPPDLSMALSEQIDLSRALAVGSVGRCKILSDISIVRPR